MSFRIPAAVSKGGEQIASSDGIASSHAYEIAVVSVSFSQIRIKFEPQKINSRVDIIRPSVHVVAVLVYQAGPFL